MEYSSSWITRFQKYSPVFVSTLCVQYNIHKYDPVFVYTEFIVRHRMKTGKRFGRMNHVQHFQFKCKYNSYSEICPSICIQRLTFNIIYIVFIQCILCTLHIYCVYNILIYRNLNLYLYVYNMHMHNAYNMYVQCTICTICMCTICTCICMCTIYMCTICTICTICTCPVVVSTFRQVGNRGGRGSEKIKYTSTVMFNFVCNL